MCELSDNSENSDCPPGADTTSAGGGQAPCYRGVGVGVGGVYGVRCEFSL